MAQHETKFSNHQSFAGLALAESVQLASRSNTAHTLWYNSSFYIYFFSYATNDLLSNHSVNFIKVHTYLHSFFLQILQIICKLWNCSTHDELSLFSYDISISQLTSLLSWLSRLLSTMATEFYIICKCSFFFKQKLPYRAINHELHRTLEKQ